RELNREHKGFTILFGTECDILDGGQMDYSDEVLKEFDFVIGAVHSRFTLPTKEMTERINAAVRHPYVNILAHPTTRKIGQRDPIQVDLDEVYAASAKAGTAIEIDAYPDRRSEWRESKPRSCPRSPRPGANRRRIAPP